ncbi:ATP-dependent RNA helicase ddx54, partial [Kappamyces sp. JEL0680]
MKKQKIQKIQKHSNSTKKVSKKQQKFNPIPKDTNLKYNVDSNTYVKVAPKTTRNRAISIQGNVGEKKARDREEKAEKRESKSKRFWELQSKKAALKKKQKMLDDDFETVKGDNTGWESGSDLDNGDTFAHDMHDSATDDEPGKEASLAVVSRRKTKDVHTSASAHSLPDHSSPQDDDEDLDEVDEYSLGESEAEELEQSDDEMDDAGELKDAKMRIKSANRKGKKSGGFQSMGLSFPVFKAIQHLGYKIPTPIQRKSIPVITEGGDVVAMARTGSGKTASFLIPMIEKLKTHSIKVGVRALILSPSRELATQTYKFAKDLAKYTDLRICVFVGGENMDAQFSALASNPDVIIATPGRLMHLIIESKLEMKCVDYLVFDEADRLFEMGFAEQLREIVSRVPDSRQTVLFSATLPKILVDFARAGLVNPSLIRLDVDTKISRDLQMYFFSVKNEEKEGALVYLLTRIIPKDQQTVIFASTKHHVEYIHQLMLANGLLSTYIYGTLDPTARKIHLARFRHNKCKILVVTDVAARGIDIPLLDNVINYNFPSSSKVFVHRVGRTARAGKSGCSWSLVSNEELPYMLDLQLFTGRPLIYAHMAEFPNYTTQLVYGTFPSSVELAVESNAVLVKGNLHLETLQESSKQGYKMYLRSRPPATKASHSRAKEVSVHPLGLHPLFVDTVTEAEKHRDSLLSAISSFRPHESIFEIGKRGNKTDEALLMQKRRRILATAIDKKKAAQQELTTTEIDNQRKAISQSQQEEFNDFEGFQDLTAKK